MKNKLPILFAALAGLTIVACSAPNPPPAAQTVVSVPVSAKIRPYPLKTCIVTDNDLDSMGGEITRNYDGQQVKFCCKPCIKKFEANKPKYLAKIK